MKSRIPDQAEKLRQLAAHETKPSAVLDKPAKPLDDASVSSAPSQSPSNNSMNLHGEGDAGAEKKNLKKDLPPPNEAKIENLSVTSGGALKTLDAADQPKSSTEKSSDAAVKESKEHPVESLAAENPKRQEEAASSAPPLRSQGNQGDGKDTKQEAEKAVDQKTPVEIERSESAPSEKQKSSPVHPAAKSQRFPMQKSTQVIAITGGKGGVGKSNIACNLAIAMAQMNKQVMVLDADLSLANVDVLLGLTPRYNLSHVIRGVKTMKDIMINGPAGVRIIPGGSGVEELTQLNPTEMARLFSAFDGIQPAPDIFMIDTAAGIHPNVMQFLSAADQVIVVTTPEPTAYTDAYALIKTLIKHQNGQEIGLLVNMAQNAREAAEVLRLMLQMCRQFLNLSFNNIGFVPRDPDVLKAVRYQKPFLLRAPNSPASKTIRNIAATILQIEFKDKQTKGLRRFFHRLFKTDPAREAAS
ncbi:MAG: MinD/ParA family protein [Candidatus Omnitrophica bacterium]|nr:MinD/ParA family protein [Candidatus Omnitrophota bacterium]